MHVQYILALEKLQQDPTQAEYLSFHNTHLAWGICELIEKNFSMHVRTTAGVFFTTACTATPPRHAHRASVATYMQQHQHQQQQQAALHAMVHAKKICQHAGSCITCTVCTSYLPRSGLHHHHQSALVLHTAATAAPCVRTLDWR